MDLKNATLQLKEQEQAILPLAAGLSLDEVRWKPNESSWSVLEVLNHLVDEEVLDFRRHLAHILMTPDDPWPEINPQGWVTEKRYNELHLDKTLANFKSEREKSIAWLMDLEYPSWDAAVNMPWGSLSAGDMLASWLAHDLLHLRQLVELRYALTSARCEPHSVEYAGTW
jgi:hypothetical protein